MDKFNDLDPPTPTAVNGPFYSFLRIMDPRSPSPNRHVHSVTGDNKMDPHRQLIWRSEGWWWLGDRRREECGFYDFTPWQDILFVTWIIYYVLSSSASEASSSELNLKYVSLFYLFM